MRGFLTMYVIIVLQGKQNLFVVPRQENITSGAGWSPLPFVVTVNGQC